MHITHAQMSHLGRASFNARLASAIRAGYPTLSAGISDAQFEEEFDMLRPVAADYGFVDEWSVASFIHAAWLLGDGFDVRIPVIAQILNDALLPPEAKINALIDFVHIVFETLDDSRDGVRA
jgi:hypothetical protein